MQKYIDKWVYPDTRKLIQCLLGQPPSKAAIRNSLGYLHSNRHWYKSVKKILLDEIDGILEVYNAKLAGKLESQLLLDYIENSKTTRSRVMFALKLFNNVSIASVYALKSFLQTADIMEVALRFEQEV